MVRDKKANSALLIESDPFARDGIAQYLSEFGFIVTSVETGDEAVRYLVTPQPHSLALVFVHLGPHGKTTDTSSNIVSGCELLSFIANNSPSTALVVWAENRRCLHKVVQMIGQGIKGMAYLPHGTSPDILGTAIERALDGDVYLHRDSLVMPQPSLSTMFRSCLAPEVGRLVQSVASRMTKLSRQELAVAEHLCQTTESIAKDLRLSEHTVRNYLDSIYSKTGLKDPVVGDGLFRRDTLIVLATVLRQIESLDLAIENQ